MIFDAVINNQKWKINLQAQASLRLKLMYAETAANTEIKNIYLLHFKYSPISRAVLFFDVTINLLQ